MHPRSCLLLFAATVVVVAAPLRADWLVTVDGDEIQTEGPWRVDGSRVVFTLPGGSLAALPATEVDLAASEARTHPSPSPEAPRPAAAPPVTPSRWVITDDDVARAISPDVPAVADEEGEGDGAPAARGVQGLTVSSWEDVDADDLDGGIALRGMVQNATDAFATSVTVQTMLYDADGNLIERRSATPVESALEPGASSEFRVDFPDVTSYSGVQFTVDARSIATSAAAAGANEETGDN